MVYRYMCMYGIHTCSKNLLKKKWNPYVTWNIQIYFLFVFRWVFLVLLSQYFGEIFFGLDILRKRSLVTQKHSFDWLISWSIKLEFFVFSQRRISFSILVYPSHLVISGFQKWTLNIDQIPLYLHCALYQ